MLNLEFSDFFEYLPEQGDEIVVFFSEKQKLKYGTFCKYATKDDNFRYALVTNGDDKELKIGPFDFWSTLEEHEKEISNAQDSIEIFHTK